MYLYIPYFPKGEADFLTIWKEKVLPGVKRRHLANDVKVVVEDERR